MVYYADVLHGQPAAIGADACAPAKALAALGIQEDDGAPIPARPAGMAAAEAEPFAELTPHGQQLAISLSIAMATRAASQPSVLDGSVTRILPPPAEVCRLLLRQLLRQLIPDADAYVFTSKGNATRTGCVRPWTRSTDQSSWSATASARWSPTTCYASRASQVGAVLLLVTLGSPWGTPRSRTIR